MSPERLPRLRAAFEHTGSGAWLMRTIVEQDLDRAHGFRLDLSLGDDQVRGEHQATEARLIAGEVDFIDTDWLSLAKHRAAGLPLVAAVPYGAIFGALVARAGGPLKALADLPGHRIGMVRAQDKNWLLLRSLCAARGIDAARGCELRIAGSKTRLRELLAEGEVDAALLYWHQVPALLAAGGYLELCDLVAELEPGTGRGVPSSFFVFREELLSAQPTAVRGFGRAVSAAVRLLRADPALWRHASGAAEAHAAALRARWLARVGLAWRPSMATELQRLAARLDPAAHLPDGLLAAELLH